MRAAMFVAALAIVGGTGFGLGAYGGTKPAASSVGTPIATEPTARVTTNMAAPAARIVVPRIEISAPTPENDPERASEVSGATGTTTTAELLAAASEHVPEPREAIAATTEERAAVDAANDELAKLGRELSGRYRRGELSETDFQAELLKIGDERRAKLEKTLGAERAAIYLDTNASTFSRFASQMILAGAVPSHP